ncbi:hypothetical protein ANSO36C_07750 [Nostoc cf. commune SO-36]|uniref:Uncharacterized protein n=1 Tax=Nostoc cf. commune SO-36 TaxID=449208 RepID=A0ABN6Q0U3_NOSCO|nr:hypothetical protein ANSO36C_07750 [Nostoc cf. commune SO-36]
MGEICLSKASWYNIRGELETAVAELRRQDIVIRSVTRNGADLPQKGLEAATKFKNVSSPIAGFGAEHINTQEPPKNTRGINQAATVKNFKVLYG